jgi:hypothetical protein
MKKEHVLTAAMIGALAMPVAAWSKSPEHRAQMQAHRQQAFAEADANHDGQLSPDEFATFRRLMHERRQTHMFEKADANHDGEVTLAELDAARAQWRGHRKHHRAAEKTAAE